MTATKEKNFEGSIKMSKANKEAFDTMVNDLGGTFTQDEAMSFLLNLYTIYKNEKAKNAELSVSDKLAMFVNAIIQHNSQEAKKAKNEPKNFVFIPSAYFLNIETGANKTRDCAPFLKSMERTLTAHYEKYGISKSHMSNPALQEKDEKGRLVFITNILKAEGIAAQFGR